MRCDYIAEGVIKATEELQLRVPLVVRLQGTKEMEAKAYVTFKPCRSARLILSQSDQGVRFEDLRL